MLILKFEDDILKHRCIKSLDYVLASHMKLGVDKGFLDEAYQTLLSIIVSHIIYIHNTYSGDSETVLTRSAVHIPRSQLLLRGHPVKLSAGKNVPGDSKPPTSHRKERLPPTARIAGGHFTPSTPLFLPLAMQERASNALSISKTKSCHSSSESVAANKRNAETPWSLGAPCLLAC